MTGPLITPIMLDSMGTALIDWGRIACERLTPRATRSRRLTTGWTRYATPGRASVLGRFSRWHRHWRNQNTKFEIHRLAAILGDAYEQSGLERSVGSISPRREAV